MPPRILVADDEPRLLHIVEMYLGMEGFDVCCAQNGDEALALLDSERFDLVILDIMMPSCDGIEVCRRLRRSSPDAAVPVIMFTSLSSDTDVETARLAGATHFISKPFSLPGLGRVIGELLARQPEQLTA